MNYPTKVLGAVMLAAMAIVAGATGYGADAARSGSVTEWGEVAPGAAEFDTLLAGDPSPGGGGGGVTGFPRTPSSTVTVTYHDFPPDAKAAFDHAARIWAGLIASPTEILIDAYWAPLSSGLVAQGTNSAFVKDGVVNAKLPVANVLYPAALANALRGHRLNSNPDMRIDVGSNVTWYTGTDGRTPSTSYDLVTVAIHEIGHQLGFQTGLLMVNGRVVVRSSSGLLTLFDQFVVTRDGTRVAKMFGDNDASLPQHLTGSNLFFDGAGAKVAAKGTRPRLWAPPVFYGNSSIGHLDANAYFVPNVNMVMAPFIHRGWSYHDPGVISLGILQDLGWTIAGLGTAHRLDIDQLQGLVREGRDWPVQPVVRVLDPVGTPVTSDNTTAVTLAPVGLVASVEGRCAGTPTRTVASGSVSYGGCYMDGFGWAAVVAASPGLAPGFSNVFVVLGENHAFIPMLAVGP